MARVLLVPFPPPGHTEPMAALAAELRAQGHQVTTFRESEHTRWRMSSPLPRSATAAGGGAMFRHLFIGDVADMARDIVDLAGTCGATLIVSDVMMPGGGLAAELTGLPWVSLSCNPLPELDAYRRFIPAPAVAAFAPKSTLESLGLPPDDDRNLLGRTSPRLHLIPATPGFAGHPDLPAPVALVGPFAPLPAGPAAAPAALSGAGASRGSGAEATDFAAADGAPPTVVVTASTHPALQLGRHAFVQDRYVQAAVAALGDLDVRGLVTAQATGQPPANVQYLGHIAHDEVFDRAAAVVTHGGWGTVSRALVRGLPLVLVPITGDQPYIGERCAALGLGISVAADSVSADDVRAAVREILHDPAYRAAAAGFAAECRTLAPLPTACSMITAAGHNKASTKP